MVITNGQDIQNAVYGVLKKDGYLIFLGSGGQEIARIKDDNKDASLPYKLNLTDSGRINLKDADGNVLSYVQQLSATEQAAVRELIDNPPQPASPSLLIHYECFPVKWVSSQWVGTSGNPSLYSYLYRILGGGFIISLEDSLSNSTNIGIKISADQTHSIVSNKVYFIKTTLVRGNSADGGQIGSSSMVHTSASPDTSNSWIFKKTSGSAFFYVKIGGVGETEQAWDAVGIMVEIYGEPLQSA